MYHATSKFVLAGLESETVKRIQGIKPLDRFAHVFEVAAELPASVPEDTSVIIFTEKAGGIKRAIDARGASKALLIYLSEAPDEIAQDMLDELTDVWPLTLTPALATFYFTRLMKTLKARKDAWLNDLYLNATIDTLPDLVWYKDKEGAHLKVNDAFCRMVGKTKEDIAGRGHCYIWGLTPEQYEQGEFVCMETEIEVMKKGVTCIFDEHVMGPDGIVQLQTYKTPLRDEDGTMMGTVGIARDVTKLKKYEAELTHAAHIDDLTGLFNRRYFYEHIQQSRGAKPITLARIDLSYFKQINDTYGAKKGDETLIATANILREVFSDCVLCRFGGGEFIVALLGKEDTGSMKVAFGRLLEKIKEYCKTDESQIMLSANMGITSARDTETSLDKLIRESDLALYYSRNLGDGECCVFTEIVSE